MSGDLKKQSFEFTVNFTKEDFTNPATRLFLREKTLWLALVIAPLCLLYLCSVSYEDGINVRCGVIISVVMIAIVLLRYVIVRRHATKGFFSSKFHEHPLVFRFDDSGIETIGKGIEGKASWEVIFKVVEQPQTILLFQNKNYYIVLPKRAIGDDLNEFRAFLSKMVA